MSLLGSGSHASRNMGYARRSRSNSQLGNVLFGNRRDISMDRRLLNQENVTRRQLEAMRKDERSRDMRDIRTSNMERLFANKHNRKVEDLLEDISKNIKRMDKGSEIGPIILGGMAANALGKGGLLSKLLGKFGLGGAKAAGAAGAAGEAAAGAAGVAGKVAGTTKAARVIRDASGRWRDIATGRYAAAPKGGKIAQFMANATGHTARVTGRLVSSIAASPVGQVASKVASSPVTKFAGRALGKVAASPVARAVGGVAARVAPVLYVGGALYSAGSGMRNAKRILGRKEDESVSLRERAAVGVTEAINFALLGIPNLISKMFGASSFSDLIVNGVANIKESAGKGIASMLDNGKSLVGKTFGVTGAIFGSALRSVSEYVRDVSKAGGDLIQSVKDRDMVGAAKSLLAIGKLLFKGAVAVPAAAANAAGNVAGNAGTALAKGAGAAANFVSEKAGQAGTAVGNAANRVAAWAGLGSISARYESGNRGVHAISSGQGDPGGASYGKYQLASNTGTLTRYLKDSGYAAQFQGLKPGTKGFNDKWKELAASDPKFGQSQHDFIKRTHYDPAAAKAGKLGFNMENRGVQDAVWSASVQHGGVNRILERAAKTPGWERMNDEEKLRRLYEVRSEYATSAMARNGASQNQIESVRGRYTREVEDAVLLSRQGSASASSAGPITTHSTMEEAKAAAAQAPASAVSQTVASSTGTTSLPAATVVTTNAPVTASSTATHPAIISRASSATPDHSPVSSALPTPPATRAISGNTPHSNQSGTQETKAPVSKQMEQAQGRSSGTGGRPSVNDIADRPRIDLQAIATTLSSR